MVNAAERIYNLTEELRVRNIVQLIHYVQFWIQYEITITQYLIINSENL